MNKNRLLSALLALLMILPFGIFAEESNTTEEQQAQELINYFLKIKTTDIFGNPFDPATLEGKPIMVNVWADWCGPCVHEMPFLDELAKEYADKITILGVYIEGIKVVNETEIAPNTENIAKAVELYKKLNISFTSLVPDNSILLDMVAYTKSLPTTFFFDENGQIITAYVGSYSKEGWVENINNVLTDLESAKEDKSAS